MTRFVKWLVAALGLISAPLLADTTNATVSVQANNLRPALTLAWDAGTNVDHYQLYQSTNSGGPFAFRTSMAGTNVDLYLVPGEYFWFLTATSLILGNPYEGAPSGIVHATVLAEAPPTNQIVRIVKRLTVSLRGRFRLH